MSRRKPVAFFLGDAAFLADPKFRALARRLPDPDEFNSAVGAFWIALASSRRNGRPDIDAEAETASRFVADLQAVGLLDGRGFDAASWDDWAARGPAFTEEASRKGGLTRVQDAERASNGTFLPADDPALPADPARSSPNQPIQPTPGGGEGNRVEESRENLGRVDTPTVVQTDPPAEGPKKKPNRVGSFTRIGAVTFAARDWHAAEEAWKAGDFSEEWVPWRELARERGILYPPNGTNTDSWEDESPSQRAMLIRAIRETPTLLEQAIRETKKRSWSGVLTILLASRDEMAAHDDGESTWQAVKAAERDAAAAALGRLG